MSVLIFRLRGAPEDEVSGIRELLDENGIEYFETKAGNWGIAMPGLWVRDDSQAGRARQLIERYQAERTMRIQKAYARLKAEGRQRTMLTVILENPVRFLAYLAVAGLVLYLSVKPFMDLTGIGD